MICEATLILDKSAAVSSGQGAETILPHSFQCLWKLLRSLRYLL